MGPLNEDPSSCRVVVCSPFVTISACWTGKAEAGVHGNLDLAPPRPGNEAFGNGSWVDSREDFMK